MLQNGVLLLTRSEVERLLDFETLLTAMGDALQSLSEHRSTSPERIGVVSPNGFMAVMPGYLPGGDSDDAIFSTKLVSVFSGNHTRGLPSHQALIGLFDANDGSPTAVLDGTAITAARTAAVSALSARLLARPEAAVLAVIGTGVQARSHARALVRVRPVREVRIAGLRSGDADALVREFAAEQAAGASGTPWAGVTLRAAPSAQVAAEGADLICACSDSRQPVLSRAWLRPGAHVTSIGFPGPELDAETITAGLLAVESRAAFAGYPAGSAELQGQNPAAAVELGELISGKRHGRSHESQITVFKSVGVAVEDGAAARLVVARARAEGAGTWFRF